MSEEETTDPKFGNRHPALIAVAIVFVFGFFFGGLFGGVGFLRGALLGGVGGALFFVVLSAIPALIITLAQSFSSTRRGSFLRRFKRNFEGTTDFWIQGWH